MFLISTKMYRNKTITIMDLDINAISDWSNRQLKSIALSTYICTLFVSLIIFALYDFNLSICFVLLTTIIMPVLLSSSWISRCHYLKTYLITILLLETLLLWAFLWLDILLFYIFFESILPFLIIYIVSFEFDTNNRVKTCFYFFLCTLLAYLFVSLFI